CCSTTHLPRLSLAIRYQTIVNFPMTGWLMMDLLHLFWIVFIPEYYGENDSQHQRITGKTEPDTLPVLNPVFGEIVNHFTTDPCPKPGSHAICHQHEQSLGTCPDAYVGFFF